MPAIKPYRTMGQMPATVIWQPYVEGASQEPALVVQVDAAGLIVLAQEGREILIQPETVPGLIKALKQASKPE